jgi:uncharacterized delta-60 repeat protein
MFKALYAILCLFNTAVLFAQVDTAWVRRYNGPGSDYDEGTSLAVDGQGNVYVTGYSTGSGTADDYATIKYDSAGVEQWVQRYNGPGNDNDFASSLAVDGQGNVYVTGYSTGSGTSFDYATIKYNSAGVEQWVQRYNGPANYDDWASSLVVDGQENVYVTGGDYGSGTNSDYATIKYDSAGNVQWLQRYNGPASSLDAAYSLAVDGQGNVYVTGESYGWDVQQSADFATIKYDSAGNVQWLQRYNGPANSVDYGRSLAVDGQGNVYVTGVSMLDPAHCDYTTIKYNPDGDTLWVRRYNGPGNNGDFAFSVAVDGQGNVYVTGESWSGTSDDCATIKYDSAGVQEWVEIYNGPTNNGDYGRSLAVDGQGNVYVTGYSCYGPDSAYNYVTIKYNSAGVEQWVQIYDGPGNGDDGAWPLAVDGQGNVYVSGYSYGGSGTQCDYATIKYIQETGIQEKPSEKLENILQAYPNPFKTETGIHYQLPQPGVVIIAIYNVSGQRIKTLVSEYKDAGYYTVRWDGRSQDGKTVSNGVYFCRMRAGEYTSVKKILLLR